MGQNILFALSAQNIFRFVGKLKTDLFSQQLTPPLPPKQKKMKLFRLQLLLSQYVVIDTFEICTDLSFKRCYGAIVTKIQVILTILITTPV